MNYQPHPPNCRCSVFVQELRSARQELDRLIRYPVLDASAIARVNQRQVEAQAALADYYLEHFPQRKPVEWVRKVV